MPAAGRVELVGHIGAAGFASGDRLVVGAWTAGPVGPMVDVMWARPDDERVLLAPSEDAAAFITAAYAFDRVEVVAVAGGCDGRVLDVAAGPVRIRLEAGGRGLRLPPGRLRPAWFTRFVEAPIARVAMGVRTYGVTPTGAREWYRADHHRRVTAGEASVDGASLGALRPVDPPCRFGFSEPPKRPSITAIRPLLELPVPQPPAGAGRSAPARRGLEP